jgi:biopolymer transport protein ExbD
MTDDGSSEFYIVEKKNKGLDELNIVPIMDMFISIIFFLLLSTSMMNYTKHVLPPSGTKAITDSTETKLPLSPKIYIIKKDESYFAIFKWEGANPGSNKTELKADFMDKPEHLVEEIKKFVGEFKKLNPLEKTIQITMQSDLPYQMLISVMDALREMMPDVVLSTYKSADGLQE